MSTTAYKIFVMKSSLADATILVRGSIFYPWGILKDTSNHKWDFKENEYAIKLPKGYEYIIENGDIAFRHPNLREKYLCKDGSIEECFMPLVFIKHDLKRPIIKKS